MDANLYICGNRFLFFFFGLALIERECIDRGIEYRWIVFLEHWLADF